MQVQCKRSLDELYNASEVNYVPYLDDRVSSIFNKLKNKIQRKDGGGRVLLAQDLRSFIGLNPSQEELDALLKVSSIQASCLLEKILECLVEVSADEDNVLETSTIPHAAEILHKLSNVCNQEEALAIILIHSIRYNFPSELQLEIKDKFLRLNPCSLVVFKVLKEALSAMESRKVLISTLLGVFLRQTPDSSILIKLFDYAINFLNFNVSDPEDSAFSLSVIQPIGKLLVEQPLTDKALKALFIKSIQTGQEAVFSGFLDALLRKPRTMSFFHQLQEYSEVVESQQVFNYISKIVLKMSFSVYADDPVLACYDFDLLAEEDPKLFSLVFYWITANEKGLLNAAHFQNELHRGFFVSSVLSIIQCAQEKKDFRSILSEELHEATSSCADGGTLSVNNLLLQKKMFEMQDRPIAEVFQVCKAKIAVDILRYFSAILGEEKKSKGDPKEIQLYLESCFRDEFGLIGIIEEQRFEAYVTSSDRKRARAMLQGVLNDPEKLSESLIDSEGINSDSAWTRKLKQDVHVKATLASIEARFHGLLEVLDSGVDADWERAVKGLNRKEFNLFKSFLTVGSTKGPLMAKYDALFSLKKYLERHFLKEKTLEIIAGLEGR